ncbi:hypothetical protein KJ786_00925 [Patescibacteria group bacterium]|nr:hypothetical protein [Patescibacteria group bacterium]
MLNSDDIKKAKEATEEFFQKMTIGAIIDINAGNLNTEDILSGPARIDYAEGVAGGDSEVKENKPARNASHSDAGGSNDSIELNIKVDDPQILIGERGQTLNEIQRLLRVVLNKKLDKAFYLNLDINEYRKKKTEYLKTMARELADEVVLTKEEKVLSPMSSYERRIIHAELAGRPDIITESEGEGLERRVVIKLK